MMAIFTYLGGVIIFYLIVRGTELIGNMYTHEELENGFFPCGFSCAGVAGLIYGIATLILPAETILYLSSAGLGFISLGIGFVMTLGGVFLYGKFRRTKKETNE